MIAFFFSMWAYKNEGVFFWGFGPLGVNISCLTMIIDMICWRVLEPSLPSIIPTV